jgi:hypothetical protein
MSSDPTEMDQVIGRSKRGHSPWFMLGGYQLTKISHHAK